MTFLTAVLACITGISSSEVAYAPFKDRDHFDTKQQLAQEQTDKDLAADIIDILRTAEKAGPSLQHRLRSAIGTCNWTGSIARAVLNGVIELVQDGRQKMGLAMAEALQRVEDEANNAFEFAKDHPKEILAGLVIIIAVGILVVMMAPWIVQALGFAELGPVEGMSPCLLPPSSVTFDLTDVLRIVRGMVGIPVCRLHP
jgi:hypothetical protein